MPHDVAKAKQVEWMRRAHVAAMAVDPVIAQTNILFLTNDQRVQIANSDGLFIEDRRVRSQMRIEAVASRGSEKQASRS